MDMISKLPLDIIETILCFLPIQEAARTSILAKEWRYRWTKIPKLTFMAGHWGLEPFLAKTVKMMMRRNLFNAISQVLLIHEGPIHEFTLSMVIYDTCAEIDTIIHYLSRKYSVKKLTLKLTWYTPPSSLFSLDQLTDLYLSGCVLDRQPSFIGFGCLASLHLVGVEINEKALLHLLSHCPLLKILEMDYEPRGRSEELTIINLFESLPAIENLSIWFEHIECFALNGCPRELPTALVHLKYLWIQDIQCSYKDRSPIIALLQRSSPYLEKLWLNISEFPWHEGPGRSIDIYSDIWLEHLNEFQIIYTVYEKRDVEFVKLILTKSPVLKKLKILFDFYSKVTEDEAREISVILFISPHASPAVEIIVEVLKGSYPSFSKNLIT